MTDYSRFTRGTVNEALSRNSEFARFGLMAAGFTPIDGQDPDAERILGSYNGGISDRRVSRIVRDDRMFRFSDSKFVSLEDRASGGWWFDWECFVTIRTMARMQNSDFRSTARSCLGVLYEWGDMANLVGGLLTDDFWCFKGLTGPVSGARQQMSGALRTDIVQIFIPGGLKSANFRQLHDNVLTSGIT